MPGGRNAVEEGTGTFERVEVSQQRDSMGADGSISSSGGECQLVIYVRVFKISNLVHMAEQI
jgi:hypothetical protein